MRARYPDSDGLVVRDGVEIRYESYGQGWPAILLLPTWSVVHSRLWKTKAPYLAPDLAQHSTRWACTQTSICKIIDGRLATIDLLCSGFREI